jgi:hypothetical protein
MSQVNTNQARETKTIYQASVWKKVLSTGLAAVLLMASTDGLAQQRRPRGGSSGGGTNGLAGRPVESNGLRVERLKGFAEFAGFTEKVSQSLPDLGAFLMKRARSLIFYVVPSQLAKLDQEYRGLDILDGDLIQQIARLEDDRIYIDSSYYEAMDSSAMALLILHEVVLRHHLDRIELRAGIIQYVDLATEEGQKQMYSQAGFYFRVEPTKSAVLGYIHNLTRDLTTYLSQVEDGDRAKDLAVFVAQKHFGSWSTKSRLARVKAQLPRAAAAFAQEIANGVCKDTDLGKFILGSGTFVFRGSFEDREAAIEVLKKFAKANYMFFSQCQRCSGKELLAVIRTLGMRAQDIWFKTNVLGGQHFEANIDVGASVPLLFYHGNFKSGRSSGFFNAHGEHSMAPSAYSMSPGSCLTAAELAANGGKTLNLDRVPQVEEEIIDWIVRLYGLKVTKGSKD